MQYPALITREGGTFLIEFPDCPGCQTFARSEARIGAAAAEALEGWLEVALEDGVAPAPPSARPKARKGGEIRKIRVASPLAAAIEIRWARKGLKLSQAALGRMIGVSQQAVAKLESGSGNVSLETLEKVARGLNRDVEIALV